MSKPKAGESPGTNEAARESAERLQLALSAGRLGDWKWDATTDAVELSPQAAEIYGLPQGGTYTRSWMRGLLHDDDAPRSRETLAKAIAARSDYVIEYRVNHSRLGQRWVTATGVHTYGADGAVTGSIGVVQDITERKDVETAQRESAERLQLALMAGRLGDWSWEAKTDVVTLGDRAAWIFGLPLGKPVTWASMRDLLHVDDAERARLAVEEALASHTDYNIEYRVNHSRLGQRWIAARGIGTYAADGAIAGMIGVVQDITERKAAEDVVRESAERLQLALSAGALGDWTWEADRDRVILGERASDIFGIAQDERIDRQRIRDALHPDDVENARQAVDAALAGHTVYGTQYRILHPVRGERWVAASGLGKYAPDGSMLGMSGVFQDITERRAAEQERKNLLESERAARTEAERANSMKDEFLATLSHELRTPLNSIMGWSQVLKLGANPTDLQRGLDAIERNARVQAQLIEDLLDMSRITSGKVRLEIQPVEIIPVIEAAIETIRPAAQAKNIRVEKMLDTSVAPLYGDPSRLQQVIWNLLSNAVKFTPKDGKVQIVLERVNSHIEIGVADTGMGIKAEFLPYVFDRFRQADASTTRSYGGLGLGLAIVKHLVELHGGTVRVRSPGEGKGTTFTVHLPLTIIHRDGADGERVHPKTPAPGSAEFKHSDLSGIKVLLVDDEPDARELVKHVLEQCDARVLTANGADEALALVEREHPDVLVSDIGMPVMDGYELLKRVRALGVGKGGHLPAIALTAFARSEDRTRALRAGFLVHVSKPVEPAELVATVASVTGRAGRPAKQG